MGRPVAFTRTHEHANTKRTREHNANRVQGHQSREHANTARALRSSNTRTREHNANTAFTRTQAQRSFEHKPRLHPTVKLCSREPRSREHKHLCSSHSAHANTNTACVNRSLNSCKHDVQHSSNLSGFAKTVKRNFKTPSLQNAKTPTSERQNDNLETPTTPIPAAGISKRQKR